VFPPAPGQNQDWQSNDDRPEQGQRHQHGSLTQQFLELPVAAAENLDLSLLPVQHLWVGRELTSIAQHSLGFGLPQAQQQPSAQVLLPKLLPHQ
jgi:hypothetical protein